MFTTAVFKHRSPEQWAGWLAVFCSAFFLYLSTLVIRWAGPSSRIDPAFFVFARFVLGFTVAAAAMAVRRIPARIRHTHLLLGRAVSNCLSVYCFYKAVAVTTVAEANILNMTYPLFVALFSWWLIKKQRDSMALLGVLAALSGIWLVLSPGELGLRSQNLWGLASGVLGAVAIIYLNISRQYHDTNTVLIFMFGPGALIIGILFHGSLFLPDPRQAWYLLLCAAFGVAGQYLLTVGFRFVTAVEGSIISSTRILLAAILGPSLAADPALHAAGWIGALLIFGANVFLALRRAGG